MSTPRAQLLERFATYETHPPLYFLQLKVWRALHARSLVRLRANSALWGSLGLFLIFLLGRHYGGNSLGLLAMTLLGASPFHLAYSQELRPYAMAMSVGMAALLALEWRSWVLLGCLWAAQLYTHYWGTFVVLAQMAYGLSRGTKDDRKKTLIAAAAAGLLFCCWLPILPAQMSLIDKVVFWASPFSIKTLGKVFLAFSGLFFNMASSAFYMRSTIGTFLGVGLVFAGALGMGIWRGPRAAVFWLFIGLGIPWLLSLWKPTIFLWYRYTTHMLPAFILLVSAGFLAIKPRLLGASLILIGLGSQVWGDWTYFHGWQKANPKAVVAYIHVLRKPDTLVVRPTYFADLFNFYDLGTTSVIDENLFDSADKRAALRGHSVLFVAFDVPSDPVGDALLRELTPVSARYFPGTAHLGITVYELKSDH